MASGIINKKQSINGAITDNTNIGGVKTSGGVTSHDRLTNRDLADQHPIEAITGLEEELNSKLDSTTALPLIEAAVKTKARGLYYDARKELAKKSYWYLTSDIDPVTKQGTKASIISGPYDLGAGGGGGGGGSITTVTLSKVSWPSTVAVGSSYTITVTWASTRDGEPTGRGTMQCYNNGKIVETRTVSQGAVTFDLSKVIISGENKIEFKVTDAYGSTKNLIDVTTGVSLELVSYFDTNTEYTGQISYIYTPYGDITKVVHFIIDSTEIATSTVTTSGEQQTKILPAQNHGHHTLAVYFTTSIGGEEINSNTLYYDLICYEIGNTTPIIASTYVSGQEEEQYIPFNVPYRVYTPGQNNSDVYFYIDGKSVYTKMVDSEEVPASISVDKGPHSWEVTSSIIGDHVLKIKTGDIERTFDFHTYKCTIDVKPVTDSLELYLTAENRSNQEDLATRQQWNYTGTSGLILGSLHNFNWQSNGWLLDDDNKTILRVSGNAYVKIDFKPFLTDFTNTGKTFEFEFATRNVKNYETRIIQCLDGADTISYSQAYAGEDTRTKRFIVSSVNNDTFIQKVLQTKGTYIFSYTADGLWNLDGINYTRAELLSEFGITLQETDLDPTVVESSYFLENDRISVYYTVSGHGFYITPQLAKLQSQQSSLSTQYKEDDKVRISFVVEKAAYGTRLLYMYINGILSGVSRYAEGDSFAQIPASNIYIGSWDEDAETYQSKDATVDIYNIRIYNNDLTRKQIVNNWIADTKDAALKAQRYKHNDIYNTETGKITKDKLLALGNLPIMTIEGSDLPKQKGDRKWLSIEYINPANSERNFTAEEARVDVQGTSSQYYYKKNFKIKYENGFYNDSGDWSEQYKLRGDDSKKEKTFTYKADVASSEGANNVELVRFFEDSKHWYSPPEMEPDTDEGTIDSKKRIRVGIDGLPIVMFHNDDFYGKMNFNNDKSNKRTFGFDSGDECWEFLHNSSALVLFKSADLTNWSESFESRYPEEAGSDKHAYGTLPSERTKLQEVLDWVVSTYRQPTDSEAVQIEKLDKFKTELTNYFDLDSTLFYYLYTELFLMVDSRAKNAMMCWFKERTGGDGKLYGNKWYWLPYDMDTALGINNEGLLVYNYDKEDTDLQEGAYIYNGQDSTFWKNVRDAFSTELRELYVKLRTNNVDRIIWSFDNAEQYFEDHQAVWCENIFNEDAYAKYLEPYVLNKDATYLGMAQGSKLQQRRWWLYNRFKYLDSKYVTADARGTAITIRAYNTTGQAFKIIPYTNCYVTGNFWEIPVTKKAEKGKVVEIASPGSPETGTDAVINIFSADWIQDIGDISSFKPGYADFSQATKLQRLVIGNKDSKFENGNLKSLNVGANKLLTYLDARNCQNLGADGSEATPTIDLSQCDSIEEVYFAGTQIKGVNFPNGGNLQVIQLPSTITQLTIRNHPYVKKLELAGTQNLTRLWLENVPTDVVDMPSLITGMPTASCLRIIGLKANFNNTDSITEFYNKLDTLRGIDSTGLDVEKAQVTGTIFVDMISYAEYAAFKARYSEIEITYNHMLCAVRFWNEDQLFSQQTVYINMDAENPGIPTKASTAQYSYIFDSWDQSYQNVHTDLDINAIYTATINQYEIKFNTRAEQIIAIPASEIIPYGEVCSEPELIIPEGVEVTFKGWRYADGSSYNFSTPVTGALTLYAKWQDSGAPGINLTTVNYNTIHIHAEDDLGIVAWAITTSTERPTSWTEITPSKIFDLDYEFTAASTYYVHICDGDDHVAYEQVKIYSIETTCGTGVERIILCEAGNELQYDIVIRGTSISFDVALDSHYELPQLIVAGNTVPVGYTMVIDKNISASATCSPKSYTVSFDVGSHGIAPDTQSVVYLHYATKPDPQYAGGYIIDDWYTSNSYEQVFNFETTPIEKDITLYAKWIIYSEPSMLYIQCDEDSLNITVNYYQTKYGAGEIDWGDGSVAERNNSSYDVAAKHTYEQPGRYTISLTQREGTVKFGCGNGKPAVSPSSTLYNVHFSYNMPFMSNYAFKEAVNLTRLNLNIYMTSIAQGAFMGCTGLTALELPSTIRTIEPEAFRDCTGLTGSITISAKTTKLGSRAFQNCYNVEEFMLPTILQNIGAYCFAECTNLAKINLPNGVTSLGAAVFSECRSLTRLDIPATVETIPNQAFNWCTNLEYLTFNNPEQKFEGTDTYARCAKLRRAGPINDGNSYNITYAFVEHIPANAFAGNWSTSQLEEEFALEQVILPNTIKSLGENAFRNQWRLTTIGLPTQLESIDSGCFLYCTELKTISLPNSIQALGTNIFQNCWNLTQVDIRFTIITEESKINQVSDSWFKDAFGMISTSSAIHINEGMTEEQAVNYYGIAWNAVNATQYAKIKPDLK